MNDKKMLKIMRDIDKLLENTPEKKKQKIWKKFSKMMKLNTKSHITLDYGILKTEIKKLYKDSIKSV